MPSEKLFLFKKKKGKTFNFKTIKMNAITLIHNLFVHVGMDTFLDIML